MNYELLGGKSVLLLGKSRALREEETETLLKLNSVTLSKQYSGDVSLIIEGRLMNPLEQEESARLYAINAAPIVSIDPIEQWLCSSIEANRLLMSLKLSNDQARLVDFIQNPYITDALFFKLLKLYDWRNEGLFDNDANRDVTAAIIGRFYADLDRNHNVQYAMSGLAHLIERYGTSELIEAIAELSPIVRALKTEDRSLRGVLDAMAVHPATPERILRALMGTRSELLAYRLPLALEAELLALHDKKTDAILAQNESLSPSAADQLEKEYPYMIAAHIPLSQERFERLMPRYAPELAANKSVTSAMQQALSALGDEAVCQALAKNPVTIPPLLEELYASGRYHRYLAMNAALDVKVLEALWMSNDPEVLVSLSSNPSTPVDILYQLGLDRRYERNVKGNPAYGKHIQTHNIGWQV